MEQKRILLAENEPEAAQFIENALKNLNLVVETVTDGNEAWTLLQTGNYDLVICDAHLTIISGWALIKKIRLHSTLNDLPIIVVIDKPYDSGGGIHTGIQIGADMYIVRDMLIGIGAYAKRLLSVYDKEQSPCDQNPTN